MRSLLMTVSLAVSIILSPIPSGMSVTDVQAASCKRVAECNKAADIISFSGDRKLKDQIKVEVCYSNWHRLNTGTYNGANTKWWGPVMVYASWYGDLPIVTTPCKTYWVKPGTEIKLFDECIQKVVSTGKMTRPGKYVMATV